ncbi:MAG: MBOAT family protein [Clostridium sp.]|nr:MBOAT family protein [Clostridium sp.]
MQFNSYLFLLLFLPVTLAGYFGLYRAGKGSAARLFLAAASLLFFAWGNTWYLLLILGSAAFNWGISRALCPEAFGHKRGQRGPVGRKWLLAFGIALNVALLFYFKYYNFFLENLNLLLKQDLTLTRILLPVGISFFTFQQIAWLVDSFRGETGGYRWLDYVIFTVYFPKIAMGPILLHGEFIPQLGESSRHIPRGENLAKGLMVLSAGLFKKVILAEFFAAPVTWGFSQVAALSATDAFMVMAAYTFQLYFDFSGYCDMAMGVSQMFNIVLPGNFDSPYKALSPVEFWKRWHMTLTRFLRQYIYFPLGGSRKGKLRTYINIMVIFLVSGLWHGANWTYILWGLVHGLAQSLNRMFDRQWRQLHGAFQWMATFLFVNLAWVIFRSESISQAKEFIKKLVWFGNMQLSPGFIESFKMVELPLVLQNHRIMTVMLMYGLALHLVMNTKNMSEVNLRPTLLRGLGTVVLLVWSVISLAGISTFIYFQF